MMTSDASKTTALSALLMLCLGAGAMFSVTTQAAEASQTVTISSASSESLSTRQQAIPLIAAFVCCEPPVNANLCESNTSSVKGGIATRVSSISYNSNAPVCLRSFHTCS